MTIADCRMEERLIDDFWMAYSKRRGACLLSRPTANQQFPTPSSLCSLARVTLGRFQADFNLQSGLAKLVLDDDGEGRGLKSFKETPSPSEGVK